ncbi:hypothetical protein NUW54_g170 [Trametes sanguinea]|uniref:Uncharacterized protein n=2 Tax=Trametes sanguinea TaxID=158606 RepID=A0ACC1Q9Y2_9APHY|nr:hypothetical protein NUW54_g977 [Trametes sanguinea]KAJ3019106.1 hypothetical protein NUW54_g170 [Trametes sanguinea]
MVEREQKHSDRRMLSEPWTCIRTRFNLPELQASRPKHVKATTLAFVRDSGNKRTVGGHDAGSQEASVVTLSDFPVLPRSSGKYLVIGTSLSQSRSFHCLNLPLTPFLNMPPIEDYRDSGRSDRELFARLSSVERWWIDHQPFLEQHGYQLRPRYRPGWEPSWLRDESASFLRAEDHLSMHALRPHLMDARRISDNKLVLIKRIRRSSREIDIATYLSSAEMRKDPRNHSVPVLDVLNDPIDDTVAFLIMPFLRYIDDPPFESLENVLDCCEQLLEGLAFMHVQGVAHRDCAYKNIMMDGDLLYPKGYHPMSIHSLPDDPYQMAPVRSRRGVQLKYYYVDFGISTRYAPDEPRQLVVGNAGLDQDVPELSNEIPYDPFKVDVFILGNFFRQHFLEKYTNANMLAPLVREMTAKEPVDRPSAEEAWRKFHEIRQGVSFLQSSWRLRPRDEPLPVTAVLTAVSLVRRPILTIEHIAC